MALIQMHPVAMISCISAGETAQQETTCAPSR